MDPFLRYLPALEATLHTIIATTPQSTPLLSGMLQYHLGWVDTDFHPVKISRGKRLRPVFLLLASETQGADWQQALPAAAAVELLHNFSLIHDDIEDRDTTRRGRPTLWAIWGEAQAINAGDALFALSYQALLGLETTGISAERVVHAVHRFTDTTLALTAGQALDISFESESTVDEAMYMKMIMGKTAALLGLACELGGIVAGASPTQTAALREFGEAIGMAFQMEDDLLGLWGDPARTGKPVGSDMLRRKKTLPILHGLHHSPELQSLLATPELNDTHIQQGLHILASTGSKTYTEQRAADYHTQAMQAFASIGGAGDTNTTLATLAERLLHREF
ncbi:MAG: polyprenyl synthetase family protein [Anaerolineae bacterium]|nr:polyprenyl synthetase family protein [Anaerolineae bacterium]